MEKGRSGGFLAKSDRILKEVPDVINDRIQESELRPPPHRQDPLLRQLLAEASVSNHEFLEVSE